FEPLLGPIRATAWQVVQESAELIVRLSGLPEDVRRDQIREMLDRELKAMGALVPKIRVLSVAEIPRTAGGKAPLVKSNVRGIAGTNETGPAIQLRPGTIPAGNQPEKAQ